MITLIKPLLVNITILISFTFNANLFFPFQAKLNLTLKQKVNYGLLGALGALVCMFYPIETLGDTHFDLRMIAILIITLYSGWLSGSIVLAFVTLFRFLIGGDYYHIGILVSLAAFIIALAFRQLFLKSRSRRMLVGSLIALSYFSIYILLIYFTVDFLYLSFYLIYYLAFYMTYIALIFLIEKLFKINKQFEEMIYRDKLTMIGQLTASIAHEIRNPLSTVRGFIQYLVQDTTDKQFEKFSPLILEELDRTNDIITNYLKVARTEKFHLGEIALHRVINDCVLLMRPYASYSNVSIEWDKSEMIFIRGDEPHLKQAIMNIIKNAIESIDQNQKGTVTINLFEDPFKNNAELIIEDNGRGMDPEQLKQIGLPFYTTKSKGTGLGSMITNKIIREMNGTIEYESEPQKGTTVKLAFPIIKK